jgi:pectinesterase inhibitor-like protein
MAAASVQALACATLLLVVLVPHACMAASNKTTLQDRCESYAGGDRSSFDYDYCVWTLQRADKEGAANADALGLATIAARFARATASATRAKIKETLPRARRDSLAACAREYAAAVRRLGHAVSAARSSGGKNLQRAQALLAEATGAPARCQAAFAAARQDSPLADGDFGLDDQIELAIAILPRVPPRPSPPAART